MCQVLSCRGAQTFTFHSLSASVPKHISCIHVKTTGVNSINFFLSIPRRFVGGFWTFWLRENWLFELVMDTGRTEHRKKPPSKPPRPSIRLVTFNFANECAQSKNLTWKVLLEYRKVGLIYCPPFAVFTKTRRIFDFQKRSKTSWQGLSLV